MQHLLACWDCTVVLEYYWTIDLPSAPGNDRCDDHSPIISRASGIVTDLSRGYPHLSNTVCRWRFDLNYSTLYLGYHLYFSKIDISIGAP